MYVVIYEYIVYLWYVAMNLSSMLFRNIMFHNITSFNMYNDPVQDNFVVLLNYSG